jgi:DNA-binding NarL/FixJ family response regulator
MRILICDHHVVFAESLAHVLAVRDPDVVVVTHDLDQTLAVLRAEAIDVCLFDIAFGPRRALDRLADLRAAAPDTRLILLCGHVDEPLLAAAREAGVDGLADKRQPVVKITGLLDRVRAGEPGCLSPELLGDAMPGPRQRPANEAQWLAAFLTPREREVLSALVRGDDTGKLARGLGIAAATARCHIQSVLNKMGAHSRLEVATAAVRYGMISPETGEWLIKTG